MLLPCMIGEEKPYHLPCMGACAVATELKTRDGESRGWKEATPGSSRPSLLLLLSRAPQRAGCLASACNCVCVHGRVAAVHPSSLPYSTKVKQSFLCRTYVAVAKVHLLLRVSSLLQSQSSFCVSSYFFFFSSLADHSTTTIWFLNRMKVSVISSIAS
jgi:hypothetical protein